MPLSNRSQLTDLRGAGRLAFDALAGISRIVEEMHATIQRHPLPLGTHRVRPTRGITGFVYRSVHGGIRLADAGADALLAPLGRLAPPGARSPAREAMVAAVNGVHGDYLARTGNPLAIDMALRLRGQPVDAADPAARLAAAGAPRASPQLVVLVHGLCMSDLQWRRDGHDHGAALARDLGCSVLYLHYNSGRPIHENGRQFAALLEQVAANWPVALDELAIVGHSMGGLVARSACLHAEQAGHAWLAQLRRLVFLGTPHLGAPLERGGRVLDLLLGLSPYSAPLARAGRQRSAGIQDLRHGTVWAAPLPRATLPQGVACYAAAATLAERRRALGDALVGDGLVPVASALGRHRDPVRALPIPMTRQWIGHGIGHLDLLSRPEVYAQLRGWLDAGVQPRPPRNAAAAGARLRRARTAAPPRR